MGTPFFPLQIRLSALPPFMCPCREENEKKGDVEEYVHSYISLGYYSGTEAPEQRLMLMYGGSLPSPSMGVALQE